MNPVIRHNAGRLATAAASVVLLSGSLAGPALAQSPAAPGLDPAVADCAKNLRIFHVPKFTGFIFFELARAGVNQAAAEFGAAEPTYIGPDKADTQQQVQVLQNVLPQNPDVIVLAALDLNALSPSLIEARDAGAVVVTYDADVSADARDLFTNMMTFPQQAQAMLDSALANDPTGGKAIWLAPTATTANFISQKQAIDDLIAAQPDIYGKIEFIDTLYMNDDPEKAKQVATDAMAAHPDLKYFVTGSGMANPAVNQAIIDSGKKGQVFSTGFALPSTMKSYLDDGTSKQFALWNPTDFGYLATYAGVLKKCGAIQGTDGETFTAGRLGERTIGTGGEVDLGVPLFFTKECPDFGSCVDGVPVAPAPSTTP
jgi:rhamnose transport system substrate-binding protein